MVREHIPERASQNLKHGVRLAVQELDREIIGTVPDSMVVPSRCCGCEKKRSGISFYSILYYMFPPCSVGSSEKQKTYP